VGSEGTLAVITQATLITHPQPETRDLAGWRVADVPAGIDAMRRLMQAGLRPAVLRLYDEFDTVLALREHDEEGSGRSGGTDQWKRWALKLALERTSLLNKATALIPGGCLLITGYEGQPELVAAEAAEGEVILRSVGAEPLGPEPGLRWFSRRHSVSYKQPPTFGAGAWVDTMEVATTWSAVPALYEAVRKAAGEHVFVMAHFSHAYPEGCSIYFSYAGGPVGTQTSDRAAALQRYDAAWAAALKTVSDHRATISHHHGVGLAKAHRMIDEQGPGGRRLFEQAKADFDPQGRMNPGKLWTDAPERPLQAPPRRKDADLLLTCTPDERVAAVERRANAQGATLGPLPADADHIGDALRSATPDSPRYGRPLDRVISIRACLPDGSAFTPTFAPRKAVGPDYVRWVLTAAAPIAEVSELVVRLLPLPHVRLQITVPKRVARAALDAGIRPAQIDGDAWRLEGAKRVVAAEAKWLKDQAD
jgi:alkyldihydroxyacetonephosphate synthase